MRVYLDDVRKTPEGFTDRVYTAAQAIALLQTGNVEFISLDHDLGDACHFCGVVSKDGHYSGNTCIKLVCTCDCHPTGYDVAFFIETEVYNGRLKMPGWACHSANPAGRANIEAAMKSAERFANDQGK